MATREIPGASAFAEGRKVSPLLHAGFQPAYEGTAGALAASSPIVCVLSPPGCGKSALLGCLPMFKPDARHARLIDGDRALLPSGETVPTHALVSAASGKDKTGLVVAAELHSGDPPAESILKAAQLLFDIPAQGVSLVLAATEEELSALLSQKALSLRSPVQVEIAPVPTAETLRYVRHRLSEARAEGVSVTEDAATAVGLAAGGVPTRINSICRRVLTHAFLERKHEVDLSQVKAVTSA